MRDFLTDIVEAMAAVLIHYRLCLTSDPDVDRQLDGLYCQAYTQMEPYFPTGFTETQRQDLLCRMLDRRLEEWLAARVQTSVH
jgi:hypothetical protein